MALDQWEFILGVVVFGLGILTSFVISTIHIMRENTNWNRFKRAFKVSVAPLSPMSPYYANVREQVTAVKIYEKQRIAQNSGLGGVKPASANGQNSLPPTPADDTTFLKFKTWWEGLYTVTIALTAIFIVAFILTALYIALYLGLGTYTRADLVVADYLTWIAVAFTYPAFLVIFLYMTGAYKVAVTLTQLFGIGTMAFLVGIAYALGVICSANNQWLGLGAGLLLHVIIGLVAIYLLRNRYMIECGLFRTNACTILRAGVGLVWGYYTVKTLFLILGPEYSVVLDASGAYIAQTITDVAFYIVLSVLMYVAAAKIEEYKKRRVLAHNGISVTSKYDPYSPQMTYQMQQMQQQQTYYAQTTSSPYGMAPGMGMAGDDYEYGM